MRGRSPGFAPEILMMYDVAGEIRSGHTATAEPSISTSQIPVAIPDNAEFLPPNRWSHRPHIPESRIARLSINLMRLFRTHYGLTS